MDRIRLGGIAAIVLLACGAPHTLEPEGPGGSAAIGATISAIVLSPSSTTLQYGLTKQFTVKAKMSDGTTQSNPPVTYVATGGTITTGGLYTAGNISGNFRVIAAASNGKADTSAVAVKAPTVTAIVVTPDKVALLVRQTQQFTVTATMSNGTINTSPTVTWSATGGTVSGAGFYTAGGVGGAFRVIARYSSSKADTSAITVTAAPPTLIALNLLPTTAALGFGETRQFSVTGTMSDGTVQTSPTVTWSATGGDITQTGLFTAGTVEGPGTVTVTSGNGVTATSTLSITATPPPPPPGGYLYPLTVGPTKRLLVDQNGKPFFLAGEAGWSLFAQLSDADADAYLADRHQHGFTLVMANLIEHKFATNAPKDIYGIAPFTGAPFTTPNEAYFAHVDYIVQSAAQQGIVILMAPLYLGAGCGSEGWCGEVKLASTADMTAWGQYVGNRYKNYDNIVWVIGGDTDPSTVLSKVQAMVDGIRSVDTRHAFTAHNSPDEMAITPWPGATWLNVNNIYTYSTTEFTQLLSTFHASTAMPYFFIETAYENESPNGSPPTPQALRAQSYWAVMAGAIGHVFGNCPIWNFDWPNHSAYCPQTGWQAQLSGVGSTNIQNWQKLFTARHWYAIVPDEAHTAMTSGLGSGTTTALAATTSDGSSIFAYLPSSRTVTVNPASLVGPTATGWWYNPATGLSTSIGSLSTTGGAQTFTPPAAGDWVLVLDSDAAGFASP